MNWRFAAVPAALLLSVCGAQAATSDLSAGLSKCAAITDNASRLGCFDQLAAQAKTEAAAAPQAAPAQNDESWFGFGSWFGNSTPPEKQTTPAQFGSESLQQPAPPPNAPPAEQPLDSISAEVSDVAFNPVGRFTVFLANGQIWQQLQGDTGVARFSKKKKDTVTISRGLLGSYNLSINDKSEIYKVRRLK
ncbi:MAG: hypothetical protein KGJ78_10085 [Alphaproteobacteria bacterium]|nr:hypothetical protein [Alphaproteobacteria bacterium]